MRHPPPSGKVLYIKQINEKTTFVTVILFALQYTKWRLFFQLAICISVCVCFCIATKERSVLLRPPPSAAECLKYLTGTALFLGLCSVCCEAYVIRSFSSTCMRLLCTKQHPFNSANLSVLML